MQNDFMRNCIMQNGVVRNVLCNMSLGAKKILCRNVANTGTVLLQSIFCKLCSSLSSEANSWLLREIMCL